MQHQDRQRRYEDQSDGDQFLLHGALSITKADCQPLGTKHFGTGQTKNDHDPFLLFTVHGVLPKMITDFRGLEENNTANGRLGLWTPHHTGLHESDDPSRNRFNEENLLHSALGTGLRGATGTSASIFVG